MKRESETSAAGPASAPFSAGSVSFRLYPHNDLPAAAVVSELCAQGALALEGGFDGVMTSEHHGGFAGYTAQPLQMAAFVLEVHDSGWAAPAPLLLPLRSTTLVAEEVAWLRARHPGRVGLGVAAGALPLDFQVAGVRLEDATESFKAQLPLVVALLRGEGPDELAADPALLACRREPVPVLSAAVSPTAAERAAGCGAGILLEGMSTPSKLRRVVQAFRAAHGRGSVVLIRRVWLGDPPAGLIERQRAVYESYAGRGRPFGADQTIASRDPGEVAERLAAVAAEVGADALNLRVHLPGMETHEVREQITRIGAEVIARLKRIWTSGDGGPALPDRRPTA